VYLLDTNVVSELRKAQTGKADARVMAWQERLAPEACYLSAITVLELETGVLRIARRDTSQGAVLRSWLDARVLPEFAGRILPVDEAVALRCARLQVPDPRSERDALIAATALVHGLTVVTRNTADFASTGVALLDPWLNPDG
jgi:predicted nucleic acid-binding protein